MPVFDVERRQVAGQIARLLLLEEQPLDVRQGRGRRVVDDREVRRREGLRDLLDRAVHEEPDRDHEVVVGGRQRLEVGDVLRLLVRLEHLEVDAELRLRALDPDEGKVVEALVVEPADVGDEPDLEDLAAAPGAGGRCRRARVAASAGGSEKSDRRHRGERPEHEDA